MFLYLELGSLTFYSIYGIDLIFFILIKEKC